MCLAPEWVDRLLLTATSANETTRSIVSEHLQHPSRTSHGGCFRDLENAKAKCGIDSGRTSTAASPGQPDEGTTYSIPNSTTEHHLIDNLRAALLLASNEKSKAPLYAKNNNKPNKREGENYPVGEKRPQHTLDQNTQLTQQNRTPQEPKELDL